jgi:UDP-glucose 4-epimerase
MRPDKQNAPQYIMDISKAKEELGYEPEYSYLDMLKDMKRERELARY